MLTVVGCGGSEVKKLPDGSIGDAGPAVKPALLNADQSSVTVGSVDVGKASTAVSVKITNAGGSATAVAVTATAGITATGCPTSLAAAATCTLAITATPAVAGPISGTVTVAGATANTLTIAVSGTGTQPGNFTVMPTAIELGDVAFGVPTSASVTVTANAALAGLTTGVSGADLKAGTTTCTGTLAANASCVVNVTFTGAAVGKAVGDYVVISQGGVTKSVPVNANVLSPAKLVATPASVSLSAALGASSAVTTVNVGNIGGLPTGQLTVAATGSTSFKISDDKCTIVTLAGGAYCTIGVAYAPGATVTAAETGSLTITDKGVGASVATVALNGAPILPSTIAITPLTGTLGSVAPGAAGTEVVFTVSNNSATASGALSAAVTGTTLVVISSNTCVGKSLAKGESCTVGVRLSPPAGTLPSAVSASLAITAAAATGVSATVSGAVISGPGLSANPPSVSFGSVFVNQKSTVIQVSVRNTGATATGVLAATLAGTGAAQVALSGNSCTAALAPNAVCTISVQYSPTDATGVNGSINVSDGSIAVSIPMVGTGLIAGNLIVRKGSSDGLIADSVDLGTSPLGFATGAQTLYVSVPATATSDSGAITFTLSGANAADFAVGETNCSVSLVPGASCTVKVTSTPSVVGARAAVLTVAGAKGGVFPVQLASAGVPVLGVYACTGAGGACSTVSLADSDYSFGQAALNTQTPVVKSFRVIARGPVAAAAPFPSSTISVTMVDPAASGSNFAYPGALLVNPCNGGTVTVSGDSHPNVPAASPANGTWIWDATAVGYYCDFQVQFMPQGTVKGAKTATLSATGSATNGGADTKTITGDATGPLTITLDATLSGCGIDFPANVPVGQSTNNDQTHITTIGSNDDDCPTGTYNYDKHLIVKNNSTTATVGPLTVSLAGDQFLIVGDECTGKSLAPTATCNLVVAFHPTSVGAKTGVITVTGSGETQTYNLTGNGSEGFSVALTPASTEVGPVDLGSVIQGNSGAWIPFTLTNPAGAMKTNQFTVVSTNTSHFEVDYSATGTNCGASGTKSLDPGQSCTIPVRFKALTTDDLAKITSSFVVSVNGGTLTGWVSGTPVTKLSVTSVLPTTTVETVTAHTFGDVAVGADSTASLLTVRNNSAAAIVVQQPLVNTLDPFSIVTGGDCAADGNGRFSLGAGASCTVAVKMTGRTTDVTLPYTEPPVTVTFSEYATDATSTASLKLTGRTVRRASLDVVGLPTNAQVNIDLGSVVNPRETTPVTLTFKNNGDVAAVNLKFLWNVGDGDTACTASTDGKTCDPFTVLSETTGQSCFGLSSLAPQATCKLTIKSSPASSTSLGQKNLHFTLSADSSVTSGTTFRMTSTVRRSDSLATQIYFDYPYPTATSPLQYGFLPFIASTTGKTAVGANSAQIIVLLENKSGDSISLPAVDNWASALSGNAVDFAVAPAGTNACTTSLQANSSCQLGVTFTPKSYSATSVFKFASLTIADNTLGMVGEVKSPANLTMKPTPTLAFGEVLLNSQKAMTITVTNSGESDATAIVQTVTNQEVFIVTGCGTTLAAGQSCNLTATAVPNAAGNLSGNVSLAYAGGNLDTESTPATNSPVADSLTVTGVLASSLSIAANSGAALVVVDANAKSYNFNNPDGDNNPAMVIRSSAEPLSKEFLISNLAARQTTGALVISLSNTTDFSLDKSDCMASETVGKTLNGSDASSCVVVVTFKPANATGTTVPGAMTTTLSVSADPGATTAKTVAITATAKSALDFYSSAGATEALASPTTVVGTNYGTDLYVKQSTSAVGSTGMITTVALSGANAGSFFITQNQCILTTITNNVCIISVQFVGASTAAAGSVSATLTVSDGTIGNTAAITVQNGTVTH